MKISVFFMMHVDQRPGFSYIPTMVINVVIRDILHIVPEKRRLLAFVIVLLLLCFFPFEGLFAAYVSPAGVSWDQYNTIIDGGSPSTVVNSMSPAVKAPGVLRVVQVTIPQEVSSGSRIKIDIVPISTAGEIGLTNVDDPSVVIPAKVLVEYRSTSSVWSTMIGFAGQTEFIMPPQSKDYRGIWLLLPTAAEFPIDNNPALPDGAYYCTLNIRFSEEMDDGSWRLIDEEILQAFAGKSATDSAMRNTPPQINVLPYAASTGFDLYDFIDRHTILDVGLVNVVSTVRGENVTSFALRISPDVGSSTFSLDNIRSSVGVPYEVSVDEGASWHSNEFVIVADGRNPMYTPGSWGASQYAPIDSRHVVSIRAGAGTDSSKLVAGAYTSTIVFEIISTD